METMAPLKSLNSDALYHKTDPGLFGFETTADLTDMIQVIGQARAVEAVEFGTDIEQEGFNIFAMGPVGTGKRPVVREFFERHASQEPVPPDWCYVNNFEQSHKPQALRLPPGKGVEFRDDMEELVEELRTALSAAFESEEYQTRRQVIEEEFQEKQQEALEELQDRAREENVALVRTPVGLVFAPVRDDEVLSPEELQELSEEEQERLQEKISQLQEDLQKTMQQAPGWQRELRERLRELNREITNFAVGGLIDELREKYSELEEVVQYLKAVRKDVVDNIKDFLKQDEPQNQGQNAQENAMARLMRAREEASLRRYKVNVLVDHSESDGAPVVYEDNPTYQNLIGRVEHRAQMGALLTDFNLIKAGSLHRSNGGYLLLDARKVLLQPYAWEGLKRTLQSDEIRIESLGQMLSVISTVSLDPEPIPLNVKIAMIGDRMLYYLLYQLDPDFRELFKVSADFDTEMDRDDENERLFARYIGSLIEQENLRPFDAGGVARVIERSSRLVSDAEKLTVHRRSIADLLTESDYWAGKSGNGVVTAEDVQRAIEAQIYRSDRLRERMQESILRETVLISTEGEHVGQVNGLSVIQLGNFAFGRPSRITARVRLGKGEVLNIEREVELSGPFHSKGVLILSGFLRARYAAEKPLSLTASLVFEQSYAGVDGDSASSAELYALLSAISQVPIKQSLAVTGSVNQMGQVQAIGGVNVKIEGFFDICKARGLTGDQGVLIPESNIKHLMLRQDVVQAVEDGQFHIYPIGTIDQGIEVLTGMPAGEPDEEGNYPEGTINYLVEQRLAELAQKRKEYSATDEEEQE
jgi:lon-related putative ATP-dependent protease